MSDLSRLDVTRFGAVGDGVTDDTAALQTAAATGAPLFFPEGTYLGSVVLDGPADWLGERVTDAPGAGAIVKSFDVPALEIRSTHFASFKGLGVWSYGAPAVTVSGTMSRSLWERMFLVATDAPTLHYDGGGYFGDNLFLASEFAQAPASSDPIVHLRGVSGDVNENLWQRCRFQTNGSPSAPSFVLEHETSVSYCYGNALRDVNFEIAEAGAVSLAGCHSTILDGVHVYDGIDYTADVIVLKVGGSRTRFTTVRNYLRTTGSLASSQYDIRVEGADMTHVEHLTNVRPSGTRIHLGDRRSLVVGVHPDVQIDGGSRATVIPI